MRYRFPYDGIEGFEVPDHLVQGVHVVKALDGQPRATAAIVRAALDDPVGSPVLTRVVKPGDRVLLVVDDVSRPTPVAAMLPPVIDDITSIVPAGHVSVLVALGTHRKMTAAELEAKVSMDVVRRFHVANHEWDDPGSLHEYGTLADGTRVVLNKAMASADVVIGVGAIAPHPAAGFSGGGKIIAPGVATEEAVGEFHWNSVQVPQRDVLGVRDNPMRDMIDAMASMAGLSFIINAIMDGSNRVVDVVAGHPVEAHREGCSRAMGIFGVEVPDPGNATIFVADTHPLDQDLWQGVKAMCALDVVVPDGAVVILVTPAPEGIAPMHPSILEHGYLPLERARELVASGLVSKVDAHNMVQGGRLVSRTTPYLVSPGILPADAARLGFTAFPCAQAAIDAAIKLKGSRARVVILGMGGEIVPVVTETS